MTAPLRLGLVGAGLIGRRHAEAIRLARGATLAAVADPSPEGAAVAAAHGVAHLPDLAALLARGGVDGVILATPNQLHAQGALDCIAAGIPVLVEKPLAADPQAARAVVAAAEAAGIPLAVGHHRRHNPLIGAAKALIDAGRLGRIAALNMTCLLRKPDPYFETAWRRAPGGGPILLNLIHDMDLALHLCGPAVEIQAMASDAIRGFEVEDGAAVLIRFACGALGTITLSDAAAAPWSWELTAAENPAYPATDRSCAMIAGTEGSLSLPDLALWRHTGPDGWWSPMAAERFPVPRADPLPLQIEQFAQAARGEAAPLCSGRDGLAAMAAVEAVREAARTGRAVRLGAAD